VGLAAHQVCDGEGEYAVEDVYADFGSHCSPLSSITLPLRSIRTLDLVAGSNSRGRRSMIFRVRLGLLLRRNGLFKTRGPGRIVYLAEPTYSSSCAHWVEAK